MTVGDCDSPYPPDQPDPEDLIVVPIEDEIDLHTFAPKEVKMVLEEYFWACREKGLLEVRVVHGKGRGTLKAGVIAFLKKSPDVESWSPAPAESGGWGATLVRLRPAD